MNVRFFAAQDRKEDSSERMPMVLALPFTFGTTDEMQTKFLWLGGIIVAALLGMWIWFAWKKRQRDQLEHQQHVSAMLELMKNLMAQRSRLDVFPADRKKNVLDAMFSGFCVGCDEEELRLDLVFKSEAKEWPHNRVDVYFRTVKEGETLFHNFCADVKEAHLNGSRVELVLAMPAKLRREQKREFFRITPRTSAVPALALWPVNPEEAWLQELSGRSLGKPVFAFRPGKISQVILEDISAGGARLGLESKYYRSLGRDFVIGDGFILLVVLSEQRGEKRHQFWLNCRCVHRDQSMGRTEPVLGLQFLAWCCPEQLADPIVWKPLGPAGEVPPLDTWLLNYVRDLKAGKRSEKAGEHEAES